MQSDGELKVHILQQRPCVSVWWTKVIASAVIKIRTLASQELVVQKLPAQMAALATAPGMTLPALVGLRGGRLSAVHTWQPSD